MKKERTSPISRLASFIAAVAVAFMPAAAIAEGFSIAVSLLPPSAVIITEVQTGGPTAGDEFIELYNTADAAVEITGWHVRYLAAGGTQTATVLAATIAAEGGGPVVLAGHTYFTVHTASVPLPAGAVGQVYSASLSKTDKTIALFARDEATCQMLVQDAVAWESAANTTLGEGPAVAIPAAYTNSEKLLQRERDTSGAYVDTDNNAYDFTFVVGTPGADNVPSVVEPPAAGSASQLPPIAISGCTVAGPEDPLPPAEDPEDPTDPTPTDPENPLPEEPEQPSGSLLPLRLTELLPNPGAPHTDAADEYIEVYNPNTAVFDASGYVIEAGTTTKYRYTLPAGTILQPQSYTALVSAVTKIALANSGGIVRIMSPQGGIVAESAAYTAAADDRAWASVGDLWQWTAQLTPGAMNPTQPEEPGEGEQTPPPEPGEETPAPEEVPPPAPLPNEGLIPAQITELLPNPGTPQTDEEDEFVELHNPNDTAFDLGGYVLEVGLTTKRRFVFPDGTMLQPKAYVAFFSADTHLSLTNSGGQARLFRPDATLIFESTPYGTAKDNQAWAHVGNSWQWTATPTPSAANVLQAPAGTTPKPKAATKSATTKKASAAKKVATTKTKATSKQADEQDRTAALATTSNSGGPLHPGVLAAIGVSALLYGAYEYRRDLANKFYQLRSNRAARAAARQSAAGR